jgi:LmbE family N-acetylglucosaminyl deacetylase
MNREHMRRLQEQARERGVEIPTDAADPDDEEPMIDPETFGTPEAELTTAVDVRAHLDLKRASMRAHASQIAEDSFFLAMPDDAFEAAFGTEWFRRRDLEPGIVETDLFDGVAARPAGAR